jgi:hypothetical protein
MSDEERRMVEQTKQAERDYWTQRDREQRQAAQEAERLAREQAKQTPKGK